MLFAADARQQMPGCVADCRSSITVRKSDQQPAQFQLFLPITEMAQQKVANFKGSLNISLNVGVIMQICFRETDFAAGQKHSTESFGMFQGENRAARPIIWPTRAVP